METADSIVSKIFQTVIVGSSFTIALRNCGVVLGVARLAFTLLTVLFVFIQEGMLF
ncbi:MAG: hypothetical protein L0154_01970 [Chloroflexi bacterium]|nr:hypothetical protein [Chloroflexota bacterium]